MTQLRLVEPRVLWAGMLAGPVGWLVQLQGVFALSAWSARSGSAVPLHAISFIGLLAALTGAVLAWRVWRTVGGWPPVGDAPEAVRVRNLTVVGMTSGVLFAAVIVAQWATVILLPGRLTGL